jgi:putative phosphoesterase
MRIVVISDVHGNHHALEAVLRDLRRRRVDTIWNLGDLVGYGAYPDEVVDTLRKSRVLSIAGNFDLRVLRADLSSPGAATEALDKWITSAWSHENLSGPSKAYLESLPGERRLEVEGRRLLLTHGTPASNTERLEPNANPARLRELANLAHADVVLCGHSHVPSLQESGGVWFVNPGGVGRSDDGDSRASYAILEISRDRFRASHRRVQYDVNAAVDSIRRCGLPESLGRMLVEARTLDAVLQDRNGHLPHSTPAHARDLENVLALARSCRYELRHAHQVTRLAMDLFDQLRPVHRLGAAPRRWLLYASILHDIGWLEGPKGHHKASQRMIESSTDLSLDPRELRIVACVARYHRGALPKGRHTGYAGLTTADQRAVSKLAAVLRVADGLDRTHKNVVRELFSEIRPREIRIFCRVRGPADQERRFALKKGDLFTKVFGRELTITCSRR